jgi:hypothetical protein
VSRFFKFQLPFETTYIPVATQPFTFTIEHATHRLGAVVTAVTSLGAA